MKNIRYFLIALALLLWACDRQQGTNPSQNEEQGHTHAGCGHDHTAGEPHSHTGEHRHGEDHSHGHTHAGHSHAHGAATKGVETNEIIFPASQAALTDFEVEPARVREFHNVIRVGGRILPAQGQEHILVAPVSGIVSFSGRVTEGSPVSTNGSLFVISSRRIADGDLIAKISASYRAAEAAFARAETLFEERIISAAEYEAARLDHLRAKAEYDAIASDSNGDGTSVCPQAGGYITALMVGEGEYVEVGQPLAVVARDRRLSIRAEVPQRYYGQLSSIRSANFSVPSHDGIYSLSGLNGKLLSAGRSVTEGSSFIPVTFEFDNTAGLPSGGYADIWLTGAKSETSIVLPLTALTEQQGLFYVYVQLDEEGYERREVTRGADDGLSVQILSGLKEGERVVTRGAVNVRMAAVSGAIPHGHEH